MDRTGKTWAVLEMKLASENEPKVRKGKDNAEMFRSVADRWKYMSDQNKIQDFIKNVLTPAFTFLTRDTSVAG